MDHSEPVGQVRDASIVDSAGEQDLTTAEEVLQKARPFAGQRGRVRDEQSLRPVAAGSRGAFPVDDLSVDVEGSRCVEAARRDIGIGPDGGVDVDEVGIDRGALCQRRGIEDEDLIGIGHRVIILMPEGDDGHEVLMRRFGRDDDAATGQQNAEDRDEFAPVQALRQRGEESEVRAEVVVAEETDSLIHPIGNDRSGEIEAIKIGSAPDQDGAAGVRDD